MQDPMPTEPDPANPRPPSGLPPLGNGPRDKIPPRESKKPRRRRWIKFLVVPVLILLLIVALLPTIISTSMARNFVLGKINSSLNGTLEIADWSVSWTGGIEARGIRLLDSEKRTVIEVARVRTALKLLDAIRGHYALGDTLIDDPNLVRLTFDADGRSNLASLQKPAAAKSASGSGKSGTEPAAVTMNLHVSRPRGVIEDARLKERVILDPASDIVVKITGPADPIQNAITLVYKLGSSGGAGSLKLNGAIATTALSPSAPASDERVQLQGVSMAGLSTVLSLAGQPVAMSGVADGAFTLKSGGGKPRSMEGKLTVADFAVVPGKPGDFGSSDKQIVLSANLTFDDSSRNVVMKEVRFDANGTDALHVSLTGGINAVGTAQMQNDLKLTLGYDLEKLLSMLRPILSPETREELKDLVLRGKAEKTFIVRGTYPMDKPFNEAVRSIVVSGALAVDELQIYGVKTDKAFELPVLLQSGIARTVYADRPEGQNVAPPIAASGGTINLGGISVDLTTPEPRMGMPENHPLISRLTINPLLGDKLGRFVNPFFAGSERAKGLLTVVVNSCQRLALSKSITTADSGSAKLTFDIADLDLANPSGSLMRDSFVKSIPAVAPLLKLDGKANGANEVLDGEIKGGVITLDKGRTTQNITFDLVDPGTSQEGSKGKDNRETATTHMPLNFVGDVDLADQKMKLNATLPAALAAKFVEVIPGVGAQAGKAIRQSLPSGIPFAMTGTPRAPKFDWLGVGSKIAASAGVGGKISEVLGDKNGKAGDVINDVLGGKKPGAGAIGDLVEGLTGKKKKKDDPENGGPTPAAAKVDPTETPKPTEVPRRGRRPRTTAPATAPAVTPQPADAGE